MKYIFHILFVSMICLLPTLTWAAGTPSGTVVNNQARVSSTIDSSQVDQVSNVATFTVEEILDLTLTWQDSTNVIVQPDSTDAMLTFLLTNTGNGTQSFLLNVDNSSTTDLFNPVNPRIFFDSNGNGQYDDGIDAAYDASTNRPALDADDGILIFLFNDIPAGVNETDTGISSLTATSFTGSGTPGDAITPIPPDTLYAVIGPSGGQVTADGVYEVVLTGVTVTKTAQVEDPDGGSTPVTGAIITYTINVNVPNSETATGLVVNDLIPSGTIYEPGSMTLGDGTTTTGLTDDADTDAGEYRESPPSSGNFEVHIALGDLSDTTRTITFKVKIE